MNYNKFYNAGSNTTASATPDKIEWMVDLIPSSVKADKNFEVVYSAVETFTNGVVHDFIVYRFTNPAYDPRLKRKPEFAHVPETITVRHSFVRYCETCGGLGVVAGHSHDGSWDDNKCPECNHGEYSGSNPKQPDLRIPTE